MYPGLHGYRASYSITQVVGNLIQTGETIESTVMMRSLQRRFCVTVTIASMASKLLKPENVINFVDG